MIRPRYALKLAQTKLRSKRAMLFTSVIISSLLFTVVITAIITFTGAQKSASVFLEKANDGKYLVQVEPVIPNSSLPGIDPANLTLDNIKEIQAYEANYYAQQKAQYQSLGIEYTDPSPSDSLLTPNAYAPPGTPADRQYRLNFNSPLMAPFEQMKYIEYAQSAKNTVADLQHIAGKYGGSGYYESKAFFIPGIPNQLLIQNGKEDFGDAQTKSGDMTSYGYFINAIHNSQYEFQDENLIGRYISTEDTTNLKGIPVIVSAQEAAALLGGSKGISKEPTSDNAKVAWLKQVQEKLTNVTYQTCYRNSTEQGMLQKIQEDYANMQDHKNDKNYILPNLIYAYPSTACGDIQVQSDTRTPDEKAADAKRIYDEQQLGTYVAPTHRLITYQIVGFIDATPYSESTSSVSSYIKNLLSYNNPLSMGAIIPTQLYDRLSPNLNNHDFALQAEDPNYTKAVDSLSTRVVAFNTIDQARSFMDNETCPSADTNCKKLFTADPYGSNYLILEQIGKLFSRAMLYVLPVVLLIAVIIIWFTMSRVMTESRRETAIYRAMGATRPDIAEIYLTYTFLISLRIIVMALIMGVSIAWIINATYGEQLAGVAASSFGVQGNAIPTFSLFNLSSPYLIIVPFVIVITCFISVLYPLSRNIRRSPIRDMREE